MIVVAQDEDGIEMIVVEGGSTDRTPSILKSYETRLRIKRFRWDHLENWVAKTNYGLAQAQGDFICFLHQDDLWLENRTLVLRSLIDQCPGTTLFLHPSWYIDSTEQRVGLWRCPLPQGVVLETALVVERLLIQNYISIPAPLFSRAAALRVGGLDEQLWYTADWDFWLKIAGAGMTYYHPHPLAAFRIHPQAQTMQESCRIADFRRQLEIVLERHLDRGQFTCTASQNVLEAARFSIEVNTGLASYVHGLRPDLVKLIPAFLGLGPGGWRRYLRDSRIIERAHARYRVGLASQK